MKEKLWVFIVKFILISAPLFVVWHLKGQDWYLVFLNHVLSFLLIKIAGFHIHGFPFPVDIFNNLIPFVSLMLITKEFKLKTKLSRLGWGLWILIVWHMILTGAVYFLYDEYGVPSQAYEKLSVPLYLFSATLPLVLWILFARKQVVGLFLRGKKSAK
ncbi:MAG: hypothetical protein AMJ91_03885 [candidate division Zixibacteria bacterium SM23_73_3]|nr:MAG: hypothetical protein AMJ91_03885 [candidate division Zixibacteria bacterium SM23_73_3]